ncbi:MAG: ankyrin repeat domain-containing protein [Verrucomicrobia bacterium]|nr:ankyrin repeat domain-containing protein [Verrucomicrobiota bacterium]
MPPRWFVRIGVLFIALVLLSPWIAWRVVRWKIEGYLQAHPKVQDVSVILPKRHELWILRKGGLHTICGFRWRRETPSSYLSKDGSTSLMCAVYRSNGDSSKVFLWRDADGHYFVDSPAPTKDVVHALIAGGADVNARNKKGKTAIQKHKGHSAA